MTDRLTKERRADNMRQIRSKGTKPELIVRQIAHGLGYRFRLHRRDLPGKPDLVFPRHHKIILVHGCFWHSHADPLCIDGQRKPKSNLEYWLPKLAANKARDEKQIIELKKRGWSVLTIWECQTRDKKSLASAIDSFLNSGKERLSG